MSFFNKLFGGPAPSSEEKEQRERLRRFETLRDEGLRAKQAGALPHAARCLEEALRLVDDLATAGYLAEVCLLQGDDARALPLLRRLAAAEPDNVEVLLLLSQSLTRTGAHAEGREVAARLADSRPDEVRARYVLALAERAGGNLFGAIAALTQALTARPDYATARRLRAEILLDMGQGREALDDTQTLLDAAPDDETCLLLHARALAAGRADEARAAAERLHTLNPFHREAILLLGSLYDAARRHELALALYDEAIALMPDFAEAYDRRGRLRMQLHDDAGAADDLKQALALRPDAARRLDGTFTNR